MCRIVVLGLLLAVAPSLAGAHGVRLSGIPDAYWGTWAAEPASCGAAEKTIVFAQKTYAGPSGPCTLIYVEESPGSRGQIYAGRFLCADRVGAAATTLNNLIIRPERVGISVGTGFASSSPTSVVRRRRRRRRKPSEHPHLNHRSIT